MIINNSNDAKRTVEIMLKIPNRMLLNRLHRFATGDGITKPYMSTVIVKSDS